MQKNNYSSNVINNLEEDFLQAHDTSSLESLDFDDLSIYVESMRSISAVDGHLSSLIHKPSKESILYAEELLEKKMVMNYLAGNYISVEKRLNGINSQYYTAEANYLSKLGDTVHFVGCGALPNTAIRYFYDQKLKTVCIDYDEESIYLAKKMVDKKFGRGIAKKFFTFIYADAEKFLLPQKDKYLFSIAGHCMKKNNIVNNILEQCSKESQIIIRNPHSLYEGVYENFDSKKVLNLNISYETGITNKSQMLSEPTIIRVTK